MNSQALSRPRFVRRTRLEPTEYRRNFRQIDREVIEVITSPEADKATSLMSKIYLKLTNAPDCYWEREGVLRIEAEYREGKHLNAWAVLCELTGVASATVRKALKWMHEQGVIGYFSGKNGVGLRIFFNRAASSIGLRPSGGGKKILAFSPASNDAARTSQNEVAFNDSFAVSDSLEIDSNSPAPKNGANKPEVCETASSRDAGRAAPVEEMVRRVKCELEPMLRAVACQAAAFEHERTREWLEKRGLPKAARVAQHEAFSVLRRYGLVNDTAHNSRARAEVGRSVETASPPPPPRTLPDEELDDLAGACLALLETHGRSVEQTLSEMSRDAGGFLPPEETQRVRERVSVLLDENVRRENSTK